MKVKIWDQHRLDYIQMKDKIDNPTKAFVVVFASFFVRNQYGKNLFFPFS